MFRDRIEAARLAYQSATAQPDPAPAPAPTPGAPAKRTRHDPPRASFAGTDAALHLYGDSIDHHVGLTRQTYPLDAIRSVTIEDGADLEARITATRLVLVGVFALALRKRRGGEKYLTIDTDTAVLVVQVSRRNVDKAQRFAAALRTATKTA